MRACIGTNHIDNGARLASGASFHGMMASTGWPAMTHGMADIGQADLTLVVGADVYSDNLIFSNKMREGMRKNNARVVVVDPRRTKWEQWATLWLQPLPGTDQAWIHGLARALVQRSGVSYEFVESRTEGYEAYRLSLERFTPEVVEKVSGIPSRPLEKLIALYASAKKRAIVFGSGVTQHRNGMETVKALCNLALLTGETEREGGGLYPMLTQNNAQGAFDMGALPDFLPGYQSVGDEKARKRFEQVWEKKIPAEPGLSYLEIFDKVAEGKIKVLYVFGEDPLITLPQPERWKKVLDQLDLLVVQDPFRTHLADYAHVVLPGVTFAEKDGTFTNMERRVQRVRKAIAPVGESRPDWEIFCDLSSRIGYPMSYQSPGQVLEEIGSLVPLYAGITYSRLEGGGIQWPLPEGGKKRFFAAGWREPVEEPNEQFPLWVLPKGFHYHYGIGTTTKRAGGLAKVLPSFCVEIHPEDAQRAGLMSGDPVKVVSLHGAIETVCKISRDVPRGVAYVATYFYPAFVNNLLGPGYGPVSRNPEYRVVVGRVEKR